MKHLFLTLIACFYAQGGLYQICNQQGDWCVGTLTLAGYYVEVACFDKRKEAEDYVNGL